MSSTTSLAPLSFYGSSNDPPPHEKELPLTPSIAVANALSTTTKSVKRLANTVHDGFRVEDFLAGLGTAVFVAPFVTTIDKSVVEAANGKAATISQGLKEGFGTLARNPLGYIRRKEFGFVVCVYTLTFWAANAAATYASKDENSISPESARFLSTIAVNIPGSVMQDRMFTRWFGLGRPRSVPKLTLGLWAVRDMTTCASSFSLPLMVSGATGVPLTATTLCLPVVTQFFSSPLHLLGLNLYNKPGISAGVIAAGAGAAGPATMLAAAPTGVVGATSVASPAAATMVTPSVAAAGVVPGVGNAPVSTVSWFDRARFVQANYWRTTAARIGRIGPTFGIGSNLNNWLRESIGEKMKL